VLASLFVDHEIGDTAGDRFLDEGDWVACEVVFAVAWDPVEMDGCGVDCVPASTPAHVDPLTDDGDWVPCEAVWAVAWDPVDLD
jgi:hypothetical protein